MKYTTCLSIICTFFTLQAEKITAQCSGGTNGGALTSAPNSSYQTQAVTSGNYYTFTVPAGCMPTYDFSLCAAEGGSCTFDSQLTINDNTGVYAGGYNDDFCGLQSHVTWTPAAAGTYQVYLTDFFCVNSGSVATLAYRAITPPVMAYSSSATVQASTATVMKCDLDQVIVGIQVTTAGSCNPLSLTQVKLGAGSSTSATLADVSAIHLYYTGTSSTFSTTNEFVPGGTTVAGGSNTLNGSQTLASGTNYFWVTYDMNAGATTGNLVDASCTQLTVAGATQVPGVTNPAGTRSIIVCSTYPGTSASGLTHWVKSDAGVTGSPVSAWADQSGAGITGNMVQAVVAAQPSVDPGAINYQNYLRFDGAASILTSANTFAGTAMFNATDNTIFMVKNLKAGTVDYKWETAPTGPYRIGEEYNAGTQRIDFTDDWSGKNTSSSTTISNTDVITEYLSNSSTLTLKLNGNTDAVLPHSLTFAPGATTSTFNLGGNGADNVLYAQVDIAEEMTYNKALSSNELRRVESYLSLKYGMTLQNNKGAGSSVSYQSSDGTLIWNNQSGFHNYVIGLGRDNAAGNSGLNKLKTTSTASLNGSTDILILANGNMTTPAALSNDKSFLLTGNNAGTLLTPVWLGANHGGPVTFIQAITTRVWATQKTGTFTGNVIMEFDMSQINGPTGLGSNANADMRLLIDDNQNFSDGSFGEYTISPTAGYSITGGKLDFSVPYADIQPGTGYFVLGSVNQVTASLPVHFETVGAHCTDRAAEVQWTTMTETNNNLFTIERASDNLLFKAIGTVPGAGNSSTARQYSWQDENPLSETAYYRIRQTDFNGTSTVSKIIPLPGCATFKAGVYPNPFNGHTTLFVESETDAMASFRIYTVLGQTVEAQTQLRSISKGRTEIDLNLADLAAGIYYLQFTLNGNTVTHKLIKN
ncbi:MAG: BNR-repeat neuraminidase N-terminal domain-containing protein [Bacteroidia bacterium]